MPNVGVGARSLSCAVLLFVAASCGASSDGPNGPPPLRNSIAFVSNRSGADEIYVMDADGSNVRKIPTLVGQKSYPAVSPDGEKIVFTIGDLQTSGTSSMYVVGSDGTGLLRLTEIPGVDYLPSWSPDGSHITFVSTRDDNSEIYVMKADGTEQTNLTNNPASDSRPSWSPTHNTILFESDRTAETDIYSMTAAGGSVTNLVAGSAARWSPTGSRFLFKRGGQIWVSSTTDSSSVAQITTDAASYFTPGWSSDESRIIFANTIGDHEEIWTVSSANGGNAQQLTPDDQGDSYYPNWTVR